MLIVFCKKKVLFKVIDSLCESLFWNGFLVLLLEGYLDFTIGCAANIGYLQWKSWEDILNLLFAIILVPVLLLTPFAIVVFLKKNKEKLHHKSF